MNGAQRTMGRPSFDGRFDFVLGWLEPMDCEAFKFGGISSLKSRININPSRPRKPSSLKVLVGLREGELRGLEWQDYNGTEITVSRSIWKSFIKSAKDQGEPQFRSSDSFVSGDSRRVPAEHAQSDVGGDFSHRLRASDGHG
jgi:hypothetical protein